MKGYVDDIEKITEERIQALEKVVYTGNHLQLVVMSLKPGEDIGEEVHPKVDQTLELKKVKERWLWMVKRQSLRMVLQLMPSGVRHNVVNTSDTEKLKLYTIYTPANHIDGIVHATKEDAMADEEDEAFSEGIIFIVIKEGSGSILFELSLEKTHLLFVLVLMLIRKNC